MRILVLAPQPFYVDRGTPIATDILVRALSERRYTVDLVVYGEGQRREYPGLTIHRSRMPKWLSGFGPGFSLRKLVADAFVFRTAARLTREREYDVVHASEEGVFIAMWLKRRRGLPYIYDMDSSIAQQMVEQIPRLRPLTRLFDWCEAKAIRGAVAVAPMCRALARRARARGAAHVTTLYDISQLEQPDRAATGELRRRLDLDAAPILMYVGNLEPYQGVDLLLEAYAIAVRRGVAANLVIAGGSEAGIAAYEARAAALGVADRTRFTGQWPAARLDELLAEADILTAPRIRGTNTPLKIFPYLHSGRPVLVTALPMHTQLLTEEVALLAPAKPAALAEAIERLSKDPALRRRLGVAGRAFAERCHTYPAHRQRVATLYGHVAAAVGRGTDASIYEVAAAGRE